MPRYVKHGLRGGALRAKKPPELKAWEGIVDRCTNSKNKDWQWYGGKGVTICAEWRENPATFIAYIGQRPSPKHTVDRIDGTKGYEPGNVRWATMKEQARNRSNNRTVVFNGDRICASEAAERLGFPAHVVSRRLWRGWSEERALSEPIRVR